MFDFPATFGHNSFAFNAHRNADGSLNHTNAKATVTIDDRDFDPSFRDLRAPLQLGQGGTLGRVHKGFGSLKLSGRIRVPDASQQGSLADQERAMRAAFDEYLCYLDSPSTDGAYAFDFSEWTTDTVTYPSGIIALRYYCRPIGVRLHDNLTDRASRQYGLGLVLGDPRVYEQTEQSLALTPASPSGAVSNRGTAPAPLKVTIVTSANGASNFTLSDGTTSFILDLSAVGATTVVVVMEWSGPYGEGRKITKGGVRAASLKTSGADTWLKVPVGSTNFSIANTTSVTSCTLNWYHARA